MLTEIKEKVDPTSFAISCFLGFFVGSILGSLAIAYCSTLPLN